jgi:protein involved in polysaccharide export with SLBB domain
MAFHSCLPTRALRRVLGLLLTSLAMMATPALSLDTTAIRVGDRLKVTFFEAMDVSDAKPGRGNDAADAKLQMFYQRLDLSGEYPVEPGGAISVPILGAIGAAGQSVAGVRNSLTAAMRKTLGRNANITVAIVQRQPVYVTGVVRNPGAYPYRPGMIAIQALALAGGPERDSSTQGSQVLEFLRQKEAATVARDRLKRALARKAYLTALRDNTKEVVTPPQLVELAGPEEAAILMASERRVVDLRAQSQQRERKAKTETLSALRDEISLINERLSNFDAQIKARGDRLQKMEALFARQVVDEERTASVRRDYLDVEGRRNEFRVTLLQATHRLSKAESDLQQLQLAQRIEIENEINQLDRQIAESRQASLFVDAASLLTPESNCCGSAALRFEIIRDNGTGSEVTTATETSPLAPGDVVRVTISRDQPPIGNDRRAATGAPANRAPF